MEVIVFLNLVSHFLVEFLFYECYQRIVRVTSSKGISYLGILQNLNPNLFENLVILVQKVLEGAVGYVENFGNRPSLVLLRLSWFTNATGNHLLLFVFQLQLSFEIHLDAQFVKVNLVEYLHGQGFHCVWQIFVEHFAEHVELLQFWVNKIHQLGHESILTHVAVHVLPV